MKSYQKKGVIGNVMLSLPIIIGLFMLVTAFLIISIFSNQLFGKEVNFIETNTKIIQTELKNIDDMLSLRIFLELNLAVIKEANSVAVTPISNPLPEIEKILSDFTPQGNCSYIEFLPENGYITSYYGVDKSEQNIKKMNYLNNFYSQLSKKTDIKTFSKSGEIKLSSYKFYSGECQNKINSQLNTGAKNV